MPQAQIDREQLGEIAYLQSELRKLNSQIIDLKVERDKWRNKVLEYEKEQQHNHYDDAKYTYETYLLLIEYFEDFLIEHDLPLPVELSDLRTDIQVELTELEKLRGQ